MFEIRFSTNLLRYRKNKRFTQEELAHIIGVERQTISKWERGVSEPGISDASKLSEALGCPLQNLVYGKEKNVLPKDDVMLFCKKENGEAMKKRDVFEDLEDYINSPWRHGLEIVKDLREEYEELKKKYNSDGCQFEVFGRLPVMEFLFFYHELNESIRLSKESLESLPTDTTLLDLWTECLYPLYPEDCCGLLAKDFLYFEEGREERKNNSYEFGNYLPQARGLFERYNYEFLCKLQVALESFVKRMFERGGCDDIPRAKKPIEEIFFVIMDRLSESLFDCLDDDDYPFSKDDYNYVLTEEEWAEEHENEPNAKPEDRYRWDEGWYYDCLEDTDVLDILYDVDEEFNNDSFIPVKSSSIDLYSGSIYQFENWFEDTFFVDNNHWKGAM